MEDLGTLDGEAESIASAVSEDGSVIVGYSGTTAFRWTASGGMQPLGVSGFFQPRGINADGSVVVGQQVSGAWMWSAGLGGVNLNSYLPSIGISLAGWQLDDATGVSDDGRVIVGSGFHHGVREAWMVTIPEPGVCAVGICGLPRMLRRRR